MGSRPRNKVAPLAQCSRLLQRLDLGLSVAEFTQNLFGVLPDLGWWPRNARFGEAKADRIVDSARPVRRLARYQFGADRGTCESRAIGPRAIGVERRADPAAFASLVAMA